MEPAKLVDPPADQLVPLSKPPLALARTKKGVSKAAVKVLGPTGEELFNEMPFDKLRTEVESKFNLQDDFTLVVNDQTHYEVNSVPSLQMALRWAIGHGRLLLLRVKEGVPTRVSPIFGPKPTLEPGEDY